MIFSPEGAWLKIAEKNRHFLFTLFLSTIPLLAAALAVEGLGIRKFGEGLGEFGRINVVDTVIAKYLCTEFILSLAFILGGSWFLLEVARSFNSPTTFSQAFNTLAIGASPLLLMRALDGLPILYTWLCWGIGAGLAVRALYHGVAVVIKPEQTKGFGLYIVSVFIVLFLGALAHFIAVSVLHGKILRDAFAG
jgi:hypothetical protein